MKAVILAAGISSRLRPLTNSTPKCLLQINGKTLLERTLDNLVSNEIRDFVVVTGYLHEQIETFILRRYPTLSFKFIYNERFASTNNIYSLWLAKEAVKGEEVLLLDSDILFDGAMIDVLLKASSDVLALNNHPLGEEEIKVVVDSLGNVLEINKTCNPASAIGESIGIEKMSASYQKALFNELDKMIIEEGLDNVFYEKAFERLIPQGYSFSVADVTSYFSMELDTVEDFEHAQRTFAKNEYRAF